MKKEEKRGLFISLTKRKAKEMISERENKLNRKLTKEEKKAIKKEAAKKVRRKIAAISVFGIASILGGISISNKTSLLPEETNKIVKETNNPNNPFKETIVYKNGITEKDVLQYFKNLYIEEYEKITGDDTLTTEDISISRTYQNYVYQLDDGTLVTHGEKVDVAKNGIDADGKSWKSLSNILSYTVRKKTNNEENGKNGKDDDSEVIDIVLKGEHGELKRAIPGDRYTEMKDYTSILESISDELKACYYLMSLEEDGHGNIELDNIKLDENAKKIIDEIKEFKEEELASKRDLPEYPYEQDEENNKSDAR